MTASATSPRIHVIIPVRNMDTLIGDCVTSLATQLGPGDEITVVDDCSSDETGHVAKDAGATVLQTERQSGPYIARHLAAAGSSGDYLLFVDARCVARPGLLEIHRRLLADPATVLSCTNIDIRPGPSLAERIAVHHDYFNVAGKIASPDRPDFFPTVNLGVKRSAYEAVGGFRPLRSGSDADLCWRIQFAQLGRMGFDERSMMSWRPRTKLLDLVEQNYRYGLGTAFLTWLHASDMKTFRADRPVGVVPVAVAAEAAPTSMTIRVAALVLHVAFKVGLVRGTRRYAAVPDPTTFRPMGARSA